MLCSRIIHLTIFIPYLTRQKDNGVLSYPSSDVVKILWIAESIFKQFLGDAPSQLSLASKSLRMKMKNAAMRELFGKKYFLFTCHDVQNRHPFQRPTFYTDFESDRRRTMRLLR